jgi:hypothetical protein
MVAHSREVVSIEDKSNRVALLENVSVPNATDYNFACLIPEVVNSSFLQIVAATFPMNAGVLP